MAATCPKCGGKLRLTDWRPNCPHCGINMIYYGMEERLLLDADKAEAEHARTQPKIDRIKAATVGSPLAIVRLVMSLIPLGALFLPLARMEFTAPFVSFSEKINVLSIVDMLSNTNLDALLSVFRSPVFGPTFAFYTVAVVCVLLSAAGVLFHTIFQTLACSPKGKPRNLTFNIFNLLMAVASIVCFSLFSSRIQSFFPGVMRVSSLAFGAFIYLALIVASFVIDVVCLVKGIPVRYKECFVGNIPADKYFQLVEDGVPLEQIRQVMAEHTAQKEAEKKAQEEAKAAAEADTAENADKETVEAK